MLIAEIRRKLMDLDDTVAEDRSAVTQLRTLLRETKEDLLTADVFGVLKYLPRPIYLASVLEAIAARNPEATQFIEHLPSLQRSAARLAFRFWPNYATPEWLMGTRTEPDVEVSDEQTLLFFEAKLHSGFGDQQIERELAVAADQAIGRQFFLVLVTPSSQPPRFRYGDRRLDPREYLVRVASDGTLLPAAKVLKDHSRRVLWISWTGILDALEKARKLHAKAADAQAECVSRANDMLDDLSELMLLRGMQSFHGINDVTQQSRFLNPARPILFSVRRVSTELIPSFRLARVVAAKPVPIIWRSGSRTCSMSIPSVVAQWSVEPVSFHLFKRDSRQ